MIRPLTVLSLLLCLLPGCGPLTFVVGVSPGEQTLQAKAVATDDKPQGLVAVVDVTGVIVNAQTPGLLQSGPNPVAELHELLDLAGRDGRVKAVVLRINSPGGGVTASDMMYREVQRFRRETGKPVVALLMDVAASGGYYLACASDEIVAYPTTVTGSVGVIIQTVSVKPALDRWGIEATTITSGDAKAAGTPLSTLTDEQQAILRGMVGDFFQRFRDVVTTARPGIDESAYDRVFDGRVFSGVDAAELGLVDELGDIYTAFDRAKQRAGMKRAALIVYHRPVEYVASPYAAAPPAPGSPPQGTQINLAQLNLNGEGGGLGLPVGFYYLWRP